MALDTAILQGRFTSTGQAVNLNLRSGWDWIKVYNQTVLFAAGGGNGAQFYFQKGMTNGRGVVYTKEATIGALVPSQIAANSGFFYLDSSVMTPGVRAAITAMTAANPPVITSNGHGLSVGNIIRLDTMNNQGQVSGLDFTVTAVSMNTFTLGNINLANSVASTSGFWRYIAVDTNWYPSARLITYVSSEAQAKIYLSVTHGYQVGQQVRLSFPGGSSIWGDYAQLDGVAATIVAVNATRAGNEPNNSGVANNIVVDVDTSSYTAWSSTFGAAFNQSYPAAAQVPFSPAQTVPIGEDTAESLAQNVNILSDAVYNKAIMGVTLAAGAGSPAGQNGDVIYWVVGKSFSNDLL